MKSIYLLAAAPRTCRRRRWRLTPTLTMALRISTFGKLSGAAWPAARTLSAMASGDAGRRRGALAAQHDDSSPARAAPKYLDREADRRPALIE